MLSDLPYRADKDIIPQSWRLWGNDPVWKNDIKFKQKASKYSTIIAITGKVIWKLMMLFSVILRKEGIYVPVYYY